MPGSKNEKMFLIQPYSHIVRNRNVRCLQEIIKRTIMLKTDKVLQSNKQLTYNTAQTVTITILINM